MTYSVYLKVQVKSSIRDCHEINVFFIAIHELRLLLFFFFENFFNRMWGNCGPPGSSDVEYKFQILKFS